MCGICGIISLKGHPSFETEVKQMVSILKHRGPDSDGQWNNVENNVILGHTRLSIIDIDARSSQPFHSSDYRFMMTYNGEIYNYLELRKECEKLGSQFNTQSDTEVLIECYRHWGTDCFKKLKGMWSAVIYDKKENNVCLSRDFFGIKPLYFGIVDDRLYFSSEIKALRKVNDYFAIEDDVTIKLFLDHGVLDRGNWTFYKNVKRFPHANFAIIDLNAPKLNLKYSVYWNPFEKSFVDSFKTENRAIDHFKELFQNSVKLHCRSDVQVGSCLSGGLDSSSIVATATQFNSNFSTFTTQFKDFPDIDESGMAQLISNKFHATQYFAEPRVNDFSTYFDDILTAQDEPYGSTSIFSQFMVFKKIKETGIKVILDGQGADELLGGYLSLTHIALNSYFNKGMYLDWFNETSKFSNNHSVNYFRGIKTSLMRKLSGQKSQTFQFNDLVKFNNHDGYEERLDSLIVPPNDNIELYLNYLVFDGNLQQLLRYEDRNSMNFSIESRVPFLEPELVSFILQTPFKYKFQNGFTKSILRKAFVNELPKEIIWQKNKLGFASPEVTLLKEVFNIEVNSNGSTSWRKLIVDEWKKMNG